MIKILILKIIIIVIWGTYQDVGLTMVAYWTALRNA